LPRIDLKVPFTCPEKTLFSTFWTVSGFKDMLEYAGNEGKGIPDPVTPTEK
jgi:hypothetical protein